VRLKIDEYIKNRISKDIEEAVALHLKKCRKCCEEMNMLKELNEFLNVEKPVYPDADFTSNIMDIIENELPGNRGFILDRFSIANLGISLILTGLLTMFVNTPYISGAIREYVSRVQYNAATISTDINTATNSLQSYITNIINLGGN